MARFTEHMEHIGNPMAYQWENKCNGSISAPPPGIVPLQSSSPTFLPSSTVHGNLSGESLLKRVYFPGTLDFETLV